MKAIYWGVLLLIVVFLSYHFVIQSNQDSQTPSRAKSKVVVTVSPVVQTDFKAQWQAIGRVVAKSSVEIKPRIEGQVSQVLFEEGALVKAGDVLVVLDDKDYRTKWQQAKAVLDQDKAQLNKAESDLKRATVLLAKKFIAESEMNTYQAAAQSAEAVVRQDQASLLIAENNLSYTKVRAPFSGRVGAHQVSVGTTIQAYSTVLTTLNQIDPIAVGFTVPEKYVSELQAGMAQGGLPVEAQINNASTPEARQGFVSFLDNQVDSASGNIALKADFTNPKGDWLPGQYVTVSLAPRTLKDALVIPSQALQQGSDGLQVFVITKDKAKKVMVEELASANGLSAVSGNLSVDDLVVTEGQFRLNDGSSVTVEHQDDIQPAVIPQK